MWYIVVYGLFAIWVLVDGLKRKAKAIPWAIGTAILGPIVLPVYFAKRPLKAGEVREGGTAWNVIRNFALFWTIVMAFAAIWSLVAVSSETATYQTAAEQAGAAIGTALGLGMIAALWFFPMVGALVFGFFLKKSSIIEKGPTGPLASAAEIPGAHDHDRANPDAPSSLDLGITKIQFECSNCHKKYSALPEQSGKHGKCKKCGADIVVP